MKLITGLNHKQKILCEIMWALEEYTAVEAFIATLPKPERLECRSLIQMMIMAFADEITEVNEAKEMLDKFRI
jgi:hypothetical protein